MNKDALRNVLLESFEVIKDQLPQKIDSIANAIAAMTQYDIELATDMWLYEMNKINRNLNEEETQKMVSGIFNSIGRRENYFKYCNGHSDFSKFCRKEGAEILKNQKLSVLLFKISFEYGKKYPTDIPYGMSDGPLSWLYAYILTSGNVNLLKDITNAIIGNTNVKEMNSVKFIHECIVLLTGYYSDDDGNQVIIHKKTKEALLECVDAISNPETKSELTIEVLSLK